MRFFPYPKRKRRNNKKIFGIKSLGVIRNALSINPLVAYNYAPSSPAADGNNVMDTWGNYGYVGSDTLEITADFLTKTVGDTNTCPLKLYTQVVDLANLPNPSTGWTEETTQSLINKLSSVDGTTLDYSTLTAGKAFAVMAELDLTALDNSLFGGSNANMKANIKNFSADVYAKGSGSNASVLTNGVDVIAWRISDSTYAKSYYGTSSNGVVTKVSVPTGAPTQPAYTQDRITTTNKIYILIVSTYPSDGTIPSAISLDYIKLILQFNRTVDVVAPVSVQIPANGVFSVSVNVFSPCWDSTTANKNRWILAINKDSNNKYALYYDSTNKKFVLGKKINGVWTYLNSAVQTFSKYQTVNIIIGQSATGMFMYVLKNNGTKETYTNADVNTLNGSVQLYPLTLEVTGNEADAFGNKIEFIQGKVFDDTSAQSKLQEADELFDINQVQLHANAVRNNGVITLNATADDNTSYLSIPCLPNNVYQLKCTVNGYVSSTIKPYVGVQYFYNNIFLGYAVLSSSYTTNGDYIFNITVPPNCNMVKVTMANKGVGTFTYSNISFKLKMM